MRKLTLFITLSLISVGIVFAQATDFTTDDCNGVTHNLFDSLDAGNVIVISWVMPCGPCATYTLPAYAAVQSFASSHPGQVDFYLVDDYANTACPTLVNWGISNSMSINTAFSSSSINMSDYGSSGMPKVVVLGNANHSVFYNENDDKNNRANTVCLPQNDNGLITKLECQALGTQGSIVELPIWIRIHETLSVGHREFKLLFK